MHDSDRDRYTWSYTGNWTRTFGQTVLDTSFATNRFNQIDEFRGLKQYKPTDVGLPGYLDEFCSTRRRLHAAARSPSAAISRFGGGSGDGDTATHMQGQSSISSVKGSAHAARRRRRPARATRSHRRRQPHRGS